MSPATFKRTADALWDRYASDRSIANRNRLVEHYLRHVHRAAHLMARRLPPQVQFEDLIQWGCSGLMSAVENFNPTRKSKFTTWSNLKIRGAMLDGLRDSATRSRLTITHTKELDGAERLLLSHLGRPATPEETATKLGLSDDTYRSRLLKRNIHDKSLDTAVAQSERTEMILHLGDTVVDTNAADPLQTTEASEFAANMIDWLLRCYRVTDALIIRLYYIDGSNHRAISAMMGISESRISQLHTEIIKRAKSKYAAAA